MAIPDRDICQLILLFAVEKFVNAKRFFRSILCKNIEIFLSSSSVCHNHEGTDKK